MKANIFAKTLNCLQMITIVGIIIWNCGCSDKKIMSFTCSMDQTLLPFRDDRVHITNTTGMDLGNVVIRLTLPMEIDNIFTTERERIKETFRQDFQISSWKNNETIEFKVGGSTLQWAETVYMAGQCSQGEIYAAWDNNETLADIFGH